MVQQHALKVYRSIYIIAWTNGNFIVFFEMFTVRFRLNVIAEIEMIFCYHMVSFCKKNNFFRFRRIRDVILSCCRFRR